MKEVHNKICSNDKYYHYFNHGIIIKTDTTTTMITFVSYKWDSLDYENYGMQVVSNIRNRTTNIKTIKPHKENKRGGIKSGMQ
jgi:hypothetical protein